MRDENPTDNESRSLIEVLKPDPLEEIRLYLEMTFPQWQYSPGDRYYFLSLHEDYPNIRLITELKNFHAWCLDRSGKGEISYRLVFRKWVRNATIYNHGHGA